jgi:hypothetical protein
VTSLINFAAINENFPVAGQDNDTQVFRDNFDTIKTSFREAKTEIEDLQDNTAKTNDDNDFNGSIIANATLQNTSIRKKEYGDPITASTQEVSFIQAMYHIIRIGTPSCSLSFTEFPTEVVDIEGVGKVGKAMLELYGDGTARTITFLTSGTTVIKKSAGFPGTVTVTSATNPTLIEVWQHNSDIIFLNYLGEFN